MQQQQTMIPMLVSGFHKETLAEKSYWIVQEKYDGWRLIYNSATRSFTTKRGHPYNVDESIHRQMDALVASAALPEGVEMVLDGEMFYGYGYLTVADTTAKTNINHDPRYFYQRFVIFDAPFVRGVYQERLQWLRNHVQPTSNVFIANTLTLGDNIIMQPHVEKDALEIESFYSTVLEIGGEGIVYKPVDNLYQWNTRCPLFMKRKPVDHDEVVILGYKVSKGGALKNGPGYVSSYIVQKPYNILTGTEGPMFNVTCKTDDPYPVGTHIVIKYNQLTAADYIPKFAQVVGKLENGCLDGSGGDGTSNVVCLVNPVNPKEPRFRQPRNFKIPEECMTTKDWYMRSHEFPRKLGAGDKVGVSGTFGDIYVVACARNGTDIYCSCPDWLYQSAAQNIRTCKHCISVCGFEAEIARNVDFRGREKQKIINTILGIKPEKIKAKKVNDDITALPIDPAANIFQWGNGNEANGGKKARKPKKVADALPPPPIAAAV